MKFIIEIELGSEAMRNYMDIADELRSIARNFSATNDPKPNDGEDIYDHNRNTVGKWEVTDSPADPIERMYDEAFAEPAPADGEILTVYTPLQLTTQALKDILNAAGNGQPYTLDELLSRFQNDYSVGAEELQRQGIPEIA